MRKLLAAAFLFLMPGLCFADLMEDSRQAYEAGNYEKAQQLLLQAAEQGDHRAQHGAGVMYENGRGVKQDYAKAIEWYKKSASKGNSMALNSLAYLYYEGRGVKQDYKKAFDYYKKAADSKDFAPAQAMAWNNLGNLYYWGKGVRKDTEKAADCYKKAADLGDVFAMNNIGYFYEHGIGVDVDTTTAAQYYAKAADKGFSAAEENLAVMREPLGQGIMRDPKQTVERLHGRAAKGQAFAQYRLGKAYETGRGVDKDLVEAYRWYLTAAEKNFRPAKDAVERLKTTLSSQQIEEAAKRMDPPPPPQAGTPNAAPRPRALLPDTTAPAPTHE